MRIADFESFEKCPTLLIEKSCNHVRIKEKNFYTGLKHVSLPHEPSKVKSTKKAIKEFSYKSQRNCKFMFDAASRDMSTAICLTYPLELRDSLDGRQVKNHLRAFILAYNRKFSITGRHIWVLEFQTNGNPHFHLLTDCKADIKTQREFVAARWYKIVGSGLEKHFNAGTSCNYVKSQAGVASYMASYLKKADQKQVPENFHNVGRFWGGSRNAFEVEKEIREYDDSRQGIAYARQSMRLMRRYKSAKLRQLARQTGKRFKLPKPGGGFVVWSGRSAFEQLSEWQNKESGVPF